MTEELAYIDCNILLVKDLKERYEENLKWIEEEIGADINLNSQKQLKAFLEERLDIVAESVKITVLESYRDQYDHDSEEYDLMNGLVLYFKAKYTINNYINCILKHEENGRVYLRWWAGNWVLPNKRPLSESPEIKECMIRTHIPKRRSTSYGRNK